MPRTLRGHDGSEKVPARRVRLDSRYYLGMAPKDSPEEAAVEEHLLWCQSCIARAEESARYVDAMRAAIIEGNFDTD